MNPPIHEAAAKATVSAASPVIRLHSYFRSSAAFRVRIALALKGLAYETVPVHLVRGEQLGDAYARIHPNKTVPLLEIGGLRLGQSMAIIEYLDEVYPQPALLPADAAGRAAVRALAQLVACDIHPLNNLRVLKYLVNPVQGLHASEEAKNAWVVHWCRNGLLAFEQQLALHKQQQQQHQPASRFCHGNTPSLADCCLIPQIFNAQRFAVPLEDMPRTMAVFAACMDLPAFQAAQPSACSDYQA